MFARKRCKSFNKTEETFEILKMDYSKGNIVVSRKAILEEKQKKLKTKFSKNLKAILLSR